jgi:hypothetical protein
MAVRAVIQPWTMEDDMSQTNTSPVKNVLVNVDRARRDQIEEIAAKLRSAGMKVAEVFPLACTIAGEVSTETLAEVKAVDGVSSVEDEPTFRAY